MQRVLVCLVTFGLSGWFAIVPAAAVGAMPSAASRALLSAQVDAPRQDAHQTAAAWVQEAELSASDRGMSDGFGLSVALSGSFALVGAYNHAVGASSEAGAAYVFEDGPGGWVQDAELSASDASAFKHFGLAVSISGDTAVIAAPEHRVGTYVNAGVVYVFSRSGAAWVQTAELHASDAAAADLFGESVSVSGSTLVVGAPNHAVAASSRAGASYVFAHRPAGWVQVTELTASDAASYEGFGTAVAAVGSRVVVGAPFHAVASAADQGSAYVFGRTNGTWSQEAELTASDGAANDAFGVSVAISGSTVLVGEPGPVGVDVSPTTGAAYVFGDPKRGWVQQAELIAPHARLGDEFGYSVALCGSTAVIGAVGRSVRGAVFAGAAYVFKNAQHGWHPRPKLTASDRSNYDQFGYSVAISTTAAIIGAPYHNLPPAHGAGVAYTFTP